MHSGSSKAKGRSLSLSLKVGGCTTVKKLDEWRIRVEQTGHWAKKMDDIKEFHRAIQTEELLRYMIRRMIIIKAHLVEEGELTEQDLHDMEKESNKSERGSRSAASSLPSASAASSLNMD